MNETKSTRGVMLRVVFVAALVLLFAAAGVGAVSAEGNVAKISDGSVFTTLQGAVECAATVDTITLLKDIEYVHPTESIFRNGQYGHGISNPKKLTLDLDGYTISAKIDSTFTGTSRDLIFNGDGCELTVTGKGKIVITESDDTSWSKSMSIFGNTGKLTIENGVFANNGQEKMSYVVDNRAGHNGGNAELIVNGGTLSCPIYTAIRLWQGTPDSNLEAEKSIVTINGGDISGKRCFYLHQPSDTAKGYGTVIITGGKLSATERFAQIDLSGLVTNTQIEIRGGEISVVQGSGDAVFHIDMVYAASPCVESAKVIVNGQTAKIMANGNTLFKQVDGKEKALVGYISAGTFDSMPEAKYIVPGHENDIKVGGSSVVTYDRAFLYTVTIPSTFDFGSNLDMDSEVSINYVTKDLTKKVTMKVSSTNNFNLKFGNEAKPYTIMKESASGTLIEDGVVFFDPVASVVGSNPLNLFFHLEDHPDVAGTYTDTLTFTTEVVNV